MDSSTKVMGRIMSIKNLMEYIIILGHCDFLNFSLECLAWNPTWSQFLDGEENMSTKRKTGYVE